MVLKILEGEAEIEDLQKFLDRIRKISEEHGAVIQVFDAKKVAGRKHIERAVEKGMQSMDSGRNISNDPAMEILLYASGERQISRAIDMGVSEGYNEVAIAVFGGEEEAVFKLRGMIKEKDVLDYHESKREEIMRFFGITKAEIEAVGEERIPDLVIERVVLMNFVRR
ncbi:MAG: KEOPS complex subunit Cgi121 [Halobacteriota archaeon]|nr:KEOPS complex subunit Cgi121 [Halobacteriota archaeon]